MKKEIFFVINSLEGGGAERVISNLATYFHNKHHKVMIICLNNARIAYHLPKDLKVVFLVDRRSDDLKHRVYYASSIFLKLTYLLFKSRPKCVISFMTTANLWTGISCLLTKTDYIVSERITPDYTINKLSNLQKWVSLKIYNNAKAVVLPSEGIKVGLKKNKGFELLENYKIIYNPINHFKTATNMKVDTGKFILAVGRLSYEKGFDFLINAFSIIKNKDINLLIAGEGELQASLYKQICELNLQHRVKLIGRQNNLQDYYSQAEIFVLSSRNEGYPNALVEALSLGCPSIATNCEFGPSEIIKHRKNGLLVENQNVSKLAHAIDKLIQDQHLRAFLSIKAKEINKTNEAIRKAGNAVCGLAKKRLRAAKRRK